LAHRLRNVILVTDIGCAVIFRTVLSLNLLDDGLLDVLDPQVH
jgi:ABC-type dipeptide/oligopeptide/nickel transport system permease subunit